MDLWSCGNKENTYHRVSWNFGDAKESNVISVLANESVAGGKVDFREQG